LGLGHLRQKNDIFPEVEIRQRKPVNDKDFSNFFVKFQNPEVVTEIPEVKVVRKIEVTEIPEVKVVRKIEVKITESTNQLSKKEMLEKVKLAIIKKLRQLTKSKLISEPEVKLKIHYFILKTKPVRIN
jgi:hypothetical protein